MNDQSEAALTEQIREAVWHALYPGEPVYNRDTGETRAMHDRVDRVMSGVAALIADATQIRPPLSVTEMQEYVYNVDSTVGDLSSGKYESNPRECNKATASVWAVHLNCRPESKQAVLDKAPLWGRGLTGEYTFGDSWTEWGGQPSDDNDNHLVIYFRAIGPATARILGIELATHLGFTDPTRFAISTSGDYAEQLAITPTN